MMEEKRSDGSIPQPQQTVQPLHMVAGQQQQPFLAPHTFTVSSPQTGPQPQPLVYQVVSHQRAPRKYPKYNSVLSKKLGITQLVSGGLALLINVIGIAVQIIQGSKTWRNDFNLHNSNGTGDTYSSSGEYRWDETVAYYVGAGIWCTIFIVLSGSFAICAATRKTRYTIIAHLVLAIHGSFFGFMLVAFAGWALGHDAHRVNKGFSFTIYHYLDKYNDGQYTYNNWETKGYADWAPAGAKGSLFVSFLFLVTSLSSFIACIWSSTLCCKVLCCTDSSATPQPSIQYTANQIPGQAQVIILDSRGQPLPVTPLVGTTGGNVVMTQAAPQATGGSQYLQNPELHQMNHEPPPYTDP